MAKRDHIFISYKREDAVKAGAVRQALRAEKLNVWWDEELQTGERWEETIDEALVTAEAVVVLWSSKSVLSDWVRHEASIGKLRGVLTHAKIEATDIPPPFQSIQAVDLSQWNNREDYPEFLKLVNSIKSIRKRSKYDLRKKGIGYFGIATICLAIGFVGGRSVFKIEKGNLDISASQKLGQELQDQNHNMQPSPVIHKQIKQTPEQSQDASIPTTITPTTEKQAITIPKPGATPPPFGSVLSIPNPNLESTDSTVFVHAEKEPANAFQVHFENENDHSFEIEILQYVEFHDALIASHAFSHNGIIRIWDTKKAQFIPNAYLTPLNQHSLRPTHTGRSGDRMFYVSGWNSRSVRLVSITRPLAGEALLGLSSQHALIYDSQRDSVHAVAINESTEVVSEIATDLVVRALALSPTVKYVAVGFDSSIVIYFTGSGQKAATIESTGTGRGNSSNPQFRFSPHGLYFAYLVTGRPSSIVILSTHDWREIGRIVPEGETPRSFCFSPDERFLASSSKSAAIDVWESKSGKLLYRYESPIQESGKRWSRSQLEAVAISAGNRYIAAARRDGLEVWDFASGEYKYLLQKAGDGFIARINEKRFYVSPKGRDYVSITADLKRYSLSEFEQKNPSVLQSKGILMSEETWLKLHGKS